MEVILTTISLILFVMYLYRVFKTLNQYEQEAFERRKSMERMAVNQHLKEEQNNK